MTPREQMRRDIDGIQIDLDAEYKVVLLPKDTEYYDYNYYRLASRHTYTVNIDDDSSMFKWAAMDGSTYFWLSNDYMRRCSPYTYNTKTLQRTILS